MSRRPGTVLDPERKSVSKIAAEPAEMLAREEIVSQRCSCVPSLGDHGGEGHQFLFATLVKEQLIIYLVNSIWNKDECCTLIKIS